MSYIVYSPEDMIERRYQVEEIRRGRMGIVYLCLDRRTQKPIAIKTFNDDLLDSQERQNLFMHEASIWIQLERHTNIVCAYSLQIFQDKPHLLIERVLPNNMRGVTLKDYLFTYAIDLKEMLQVGIGICDGMIHALGKFPDLVHRDLKPENILIGDNLIVKVSDFGMTLNKRIEEAIEINLWGEDPNEPTVLARKMIGTPAVASPEQCLLKNLDTRSDIYSFGCILYQVATKRLPFYKSKVESYILAHLFEEPISPNKLNRVIPPPFSDLIMACLQKKPDKRFPSFHDVRRHLCDLYFDTFGIEPHCPIIQETFTAQEHVDRAVSFILLGDYPKAIEILRYAESKDPYLKSIPFSLAYFHYQQGDYHEAIRFFVIAFQEDKANTELIFLLGDSYLQTGQLDQAHKVLRELLHLHSDDPHLYVKTATILIKVKQYALAEEILEQGLKHCSQSQELLIELSQLHQIQKEYKYERRRIEQLIREGYREQSIFIRLAELYQLANDRRKVYSWLEEAKMIENRSFSNEYRLGKLYFWLQNWREALRCWTVAHQSGEGDSGFYYDLSLLCYHMRKYRDAWFYSLIAEEKGADVGELKKKIQARMLL